MAIINGLITLDEAKKSIFGNTASTQWDSDIEDYISAATPVIEDMTGPMYVRTITRTYRGGSEMVALPWRFNSVVSLSENDVSLTADQYTAMPDIGLVYGGTRTSGYRSFLSGEGNITLAVEVGYDPIPPNIKLATRELVRHLWTIGRQGPRPAFNAEQQESATVTPSGYLVPRRVEQLCRPHAGLPGFA